MKFQQFSLRIYSVYRRTKEIFSCHSSSFIIASQTHCMKSSSAIPNIKCQGAHSILPNNLRAQFSVFSLALMLRRLTTINPFKVFQSYFHKVSFREAFSYAFHIIFKPLCWYFKLFCFCSQKKNFYTVCNLYLTQNTFNYKKVQLLQSLKPCLVQSELLRSP